MVITGHLQLVLMMGLVIYLFILAKLFLLIMMNVGLVGPSVILLDNHTTTKVGKYLSVIMLSYR